MMTEQPFVGKNWYRKSLVSEKSFGFGFVQILGFVTHCEVGARIDVADVFNC